MIERYRRKTKEEVRGEKEQGGYKAQKTETGSAEESGDGKREEQPPKSFSQEV